AISTATPNHMHALITVLAAQAGKDVYCEKPLSHGVWEGRQVVNAQKKYNRIIQCGTQARSSRAIKDAVEYVHSGKLGNILCVTGTCYKPRPGIGKLSKPLVIPEYIDYDLWCGPAVKVDLYRPKLHYDWHWDYNTGNGDMGNQGIHQMDVARWFHGAQTLSPRVVSFGGRLGYDDAGNTANTQVVLHDYPEFPLIFETRGLPKSKAAQANWDRSMDDFKGARVGVIVQCEKGYVVSTNGYGQVIAYDNDNAELEQFRGDGDHFHNFLDAVKSRNPADLSADALTGHLSSSLCHTGGISHQLGEPRAAKEIMDTVGSKYAYLRDAVDRMLQHLRANEVDVDQPVVTAGAVLEMDPATERFTNNHAADEMLRRADRAPFIVPEIA
ncbi:MAG: Gfo/Idh/MocA family oxidoreductase, partial [Pirellulales bacterium]